MSTTTPGPSAPDQTRPPLWRDIRILRVAFQVVFLLVVLALVWYLGRNLLTNLRASGLPTGFDYLGRPAGFDIRDSPFRPSQANIDALIVGVTNTLRVAITGIALATVLGILIGVARLSTNWLVRKGAAAYVETIRNTPPLLVILFMYLAVVLRFPPISRPAEIVGALVFSNRGLVVPWGDAGPGVRVFVAALAGGLILAVVIGLWRTRVFDATGRPHHRVLWGVVVVALVGAVAYVALGEPVALSVPTREGRVVEGGIMLGPEFAALLMGLVIYTTSHIAEIVRGSILAVPKGQSEAANALALSGFQRMRYVILPQALRIMIPPLGNQYLNLTKNSSLAVAIGFFELTRITAVIIGNGHPAPQNIAVLMLIYLSISLTISAIVNLVNRRLQLESR